MICAPSVKNVKIPQSPLIIDNDFHKLIDDFDVPCWSVGTLLNLMPVVIINMDGDNFLRVEKNNYSWSIFYADNFNGNVEYIIKKPELIDACYEMMVWLLENNHIKK